MPRKTKVSGFLCPKKGRCEVAQLPFFGPSFLGKAVWTASQGKNSAQKYGIDDSFDR